jgi:hypothetical protein
LFVDIGRTGSGRDPDAAGNASDVGARPSGLSSDNHCSDTDVGGSGLPRTLLTTPLAKKNRPDSICRMEGSASSP